MILTNWKGSRRELQKTLIKDLGMLKYFLGMEFARSKEGIFVNQRTYVLDPLGEIGLLGCKAETPIEPNLKSQSAKLEDVENIEQ